MLPSFSFPSDRLVRSRLLYRHRRLRLLATRFLDVHEQGEQVIRLDGDALKTLIAFWDRLKREADDRAVNTQFDDCVFHRIDVSLHAELDIVVRSSRRFTRPPIAVTSHSALKVLNPSSSYSSIQGDEI